MLDQFFRMLHFHNRQLLQVFGKIIVFPVLAHFGVNEILTERCELFLQSHIQRGNDLFASLHDGKSSNTFLSGI
jgi:hypothetical protein